MAPRSFREPSAVDSRLRAAFLTLALTLPTGAALAAAPTSLAEIGRFSSVSIGAVPGDGYLVVWQDASFSVKARRISAAGLPSGPTKTVLELSEEQISAPAVAVAESGAWAVFYEEGVEADQVGLGAAFFDAQDHLLRRVSYPDPIPDPGGLAISLGPHVIAFPGGFAVAFTLGIQEDPLEDPLHPSDTDVWVRRVGADGQPVGEPTRINEETGGFQVATGIGISAASLVVSWSSSAAAGTSDVRARVLGLNAVPVSGEVSVNETAVTAASRLAVGPDGGFMVVWQGVEGDTTGIRIRAFGANGNPLGVEHAANPSPPEQQGAPDIAITKSGAVWVTWITAGTATSPGLPAELEISVRPFGLDAEPLARAQAVATTIEETPFLTGGESGALMAWRQTRESPVLLGLLVGQAGGAGTPPVELALESPELAGFRAWVRISRALAESLWGTRTEPCLSEALCVAGALPDRAEVIVRMVGPKPNGLLWPTLVKLSTSQAEVWLQQESSGAVRYYLLPGASPDSGILPGLFDRNGFTP